MKRLGTASSYAVMLPQARMLYDFIVAHRRRPRKGRAKSPLFVKAALSVGRQFIFSHRKRFLRQGRAIQKGSATAAETKARRTVSGPAPPPAGGRAGPTADTWLSAAKDHISALCHRKRAPTTLSPTLLYIRITPQSKLPSRTVLFFCSFWACCAYKSILLLYHSTIF